jgi:hypothetical protein
MSSLETWFTFCLGTSFTLSGSFFVFDAALQAAVEALYLALCLWMAYAAPAESDTLAHHPQRQVRSPRGCTSPSLYLRRRMRVFRA